MTIEQDRADFENVLAHHPLKLSDVVAFDTYYFHRADHQLEIKEWAFKIVQAALAHERSQVQGEAVYQVDFSNTDHWQDVNKIHYEHLESKYTCRTVFTAPQQAIPANLVQHCVNRFLGWKLPNDFSPDGGIYKAIEGFNPNHQLALTYSTLTKPKLCLSMYLQAPLLGYQPPLLHLIIHNSYRVL